MSPSRQPRGSLCHRWTGSDSGIRHVEIQVFYSELFSYSHIPWRTSSWRGFSATTWCDRFVLLSWRTLKQLRRLWLFPLDGSSCEASIVLPLRLLRRLFTGRAFSFPQRNACCVSWIRSTSASAWRRSSSCWCRSLLSRVGTRGLVIGWHLRMKISKSKSERLKVRKNLESVRVSLQEEKQLKLIEHKTNNARCDNLRRQRIPSGTRCCAQNKESHKPSWLYHDFFHLAAFFREWIQDIIFPGLYRVSMLDFAWFRLSWCWERMGVFCFTKKSISCFFTQAPWLLNINLVARTAICLIIHVFFPSRKNISNWPYRLASRCTILVEVNQKEEMNVER